MSTTVPQSPSNAAARSRLERPWQLLIGGRFVDAADGATLVSEDPATGAPLATVAAAGAADVDRAVSAARAAFEGAAWADLTPSARGQVVWRIGELIERHADELAELESLDNGKALPIARGIDVPLAADIFRYMAGWATKIEGSTIPLSGGGAQLHAYTVREPVGVVGAIVPWNFPLLMAAWKLAPALAAGCTVVLKPAEQTPLSALRLGELLAEAGVPDGVVNIVPGFGESAGAALTAHPGVDKVAFTGSTEVGRAILRSVEPSLKRVSLELGGKSPNVVFADANLEEAIPGAAIAIFGNSGQGCSAGSRLYIHRDVYDEVVSGVASFAASLRLGPGLGGETDLGPLVSRAQWERVNGYVEGARADGARIVTGGSAPGGSGHFYAPTVIADTTPQMAVVREEIFGPVVTAIPFSTEEELVTAANDTPYGLAAGIWTRDLSTAHRVARALRAGSVWINTYNHYDAALPFGGFKQSGWGREMGWEAIELYTELKTVVAKL
ncbi:aldehyde dehydrogenase family protein [Conexibacter stalactiti]|uniref:Aldehyde dehydrogenase family protein n=1 Tax=Conexibacter stalactiti TaxID=1940611 RepID=A0ABU4I1I9_9ACTN|nr:aldehyde dehydrogenase family protein [Conexibacter stalactiti]MDW5598792.1 aldehyde dehydrogenase family protein [Conexibacter stalactiti]MEC5039434.1 aldehyde dehydrogenase family protein [Conexibacter stalactiti]